jgi:hypothetical protein
MREHAKSYTNNQEEPGGKRFRRLEFVKNAPVLLTWRGISGRRAVTNTNSGATLEWDRPIP